MEVQISPVSTFAVAHNTQYNTISTDESDTSRVKSDFRFRCIVCSNEFDQANQLYEHMRCEHPELCGNVNVASADNDIDISDDEFEYGEYSSIFEPICELRQLDDSEVVIHDGAIASTSSAQPLQPPLPPIPSKKEQQMMKRKQKREKKQQEKKVREKKQQKIDRIKQEQELKQQQEQQKQQQQLQMQLFLQLHLQNQIRNQLQMQSFLAMLGASPKSDGTHLQAAMANMLRLLALGIV